MKALAVRVALPAALLVLAASFAPTAFAQEHDGEDADSHDGTSFIGGPNWDDVREVTFWSVGAIGGACVVLGVLYLFKRRIGGFPENPSWVAPISIMPASDLPGDDADAHGTVDTHGSHAPAH